MNNKILKAVALLTLGGVAVGSSSCGVEYDLTMWTGFGSSYTTVLETILENYADETGINVYHESKGGYENLQSGINGTVSQNAFPNVANGYPDHFAGYIRSDIMLPLDDYIEAYNQENGVDLLDDFYDDYLIENQTLLYDESGNGYTMGLPFNKSTEVMVYNESLLTYVNLYDSSIGMNPPTTWAEMAEMGAKILAVMNAEASSPFGKIIGTDYQIYDDENAIDAVNEANGNEDLDVLFDFTAITSDLFRVFAWDSLNNMFITLVRQWGGEYTSIDSSGNGYVQFYNQTNGNAEKTVEMLNYFKQLYDDGIFGFPTNLGLTSDYNSDALKQGNVVFTISSSGGLSYNTGGSGTVRVTTIPYYTADNKYVISQGTSLGLFDQGSDEDIQNSFDLMVYLSTGEVQGYWAATTGYYPASKSATDSETYQAFLNEDYSSNDTMRLQQEGAQVNENTYMNDSSGWTKFTDPGFVGSSTIRDAVGNIIQAVCVEYDAAEYLQTLYDGTLKNYVPS